MGKLKICNSRIRPMVACYTYVQPNLSLELCSLAIEGMQEFLSLKNINFCTYQFCRYATMRVANSRLFTVVELQIRQNKGKNVRLQPRTQESASKDDVPILARPFLCSL
jgi:hypothetical protein